MIEKGFGENAFSNSLLEFFASSLAYCCRFVYSFDQQVPLATSRATPEPAKSFYARLLASLGWLPYEHNLVLRSKTSTHCSFSKYKSS